MQDRRRIVDLYRQGNAAALATLVHIEGSSYRRLGARLLIDQQGNYAGSISGGCLEAELIRKAQWMTRNGAILERYSTLFDDTADIPYGLGCGGTVDLLLEPADTPEFAALMDALEASLHGEPRRIVTQLPTPGDPLRRCIFSSQGNHLFRSANGFVDSSRPVFDETLDQPQRLLIFGAGDDAQPMARMAKFLGWSVTVIDSRPQWALATRFPSADSVVTNLSTTVTPDDAVVLMSHSYEQDRRWLTEVLPMQPRYLGLLGARHRSSLLIAEAAAQLDWPLDRACHNLFAPVGLDLGGDGPEVIALATIAEIQACIEGKLPHSRRMDPALIHDQLEKGGASRFLQTQCSL